MTNDAVTKLKLLCDEVVSDPNLKPVGVKSYCNLSVCRVAFEYDIDLYNPMTSEPYMANEIVQIMKNSWSQITGNQANALANLGVLAIAGQLGKPHGHVAIVSPGPMIWSSKWNFDAPYVANVGEKNGYMGANWAFRDPPDYFTPKVTELLA